MEKTPIPHEVVLGAIWFVLTTGCRWYDIPQVMNCSGEAARQRLAYWGKLGAWQRLLESILEELHKRQALDLEVVVVDSTHVRAFGGGADSGPSPVNRRKKGVRYTLMTDGKGTPLAMISTPANTSDHHCLLPVLDRYPVVKGISGRPRKRPAGSWKVAASPPHIRKRNTEHGSGSGKFRRVVERANCWLGGLRRFRIRYDRHQTIIDA